VKERVRRIQRVCKAFSVKLPEAALRFPLGHPAVLSVVAGVGRASEARRNAEMAAAKIPPALWKALKGEGLIREDAPCPR
jgi:D-threo-aldose 1-dehydrogenase